MGKVSVKPKPGDVEGGYVYIGGIGSDPGDPKNWKPVAGRSVVPSPAPTPSGPAPAESSYGERLYRGLSDVGQGIAYGGAQVAESAGALPEGSSASYRDKVEQQIADYEARNAGRMDLVRDVGRGLPWMMVPQGKIGEVVQAGGTLIGRNAIGRGIQKAGEALGKSKVGEGAVVGSLQGATMMGGDREDNAVLGGIGGAGGGALAKLFGMAVRPGTTQFHRLDLANKARSQGFNVLPGMATGSRVSGNIEGALETFPTTAGNMRQLYEQNAQQANKLASMALGGMGDAHLTDDALNSAGLRLGNEFNRLTAGKKIYIDGQFFGDVATAKTKQNRIVLDELKDARAGAIIDSILKMPQNQKMYIKGEQYQSTRSALGKAIKDAYNSGKSNLGDVLSTVQDALDDAAYRSAGNQKEWDLVREQYSAYKALTQPGVVQGGNVNLKNLSSYLQRKMGGQWYANNLPPIADLAKLDPVLKTQIPNSGTPERLMYQGLMTGGTMAGGAGAGALAGDAAGAGIGGLAGPLIIPKIGEAAYMNPMARAFFESGLLPRSQQQNANILSPWMTAVTRSFAAPYVIDQMSDK